MLVQPRGWPLTLGFQALRDQLVEFVDPLV
jgi:hypothetical protein